MVEVVEEKISINVEWAKVTNKNSLKRIYKPSAELSEFVKQVQTHFKELQQIEYLQPEEKISELGDKSKFVLLWHSSSPLQKSFLDQSIDAVQIDDARQFREIMLQHLIADSQTGKQSQPRFVIRVLEPYDPAKKMLDISDLAKSKLEEQPQVSPVKEYKDDFSPEDYDIVDVQPSLAEQHIDLSQAIGPDSGKEASKGDQPIKAESRFEQKSQIVKSIFAQDAEEAVSLNGSEQADSVDVISDCAKSEDVDSGEDNDSAGDKSEVIESVKISGVSDDEDVKEVQDDQVTKQVLQNVLTRVDNLNPYNDSEDKELPTNLKNSPSLLAQVREMIKQELNEEGPKYIQALAEEYNLKVKKDADLKDQQEIDKKQQQLNPFELAKQHSDQMQVSWRFEEEGNSAKNEQEMSDSKLTYDANEGGWNMQASKGLDLSVVKVELQNGLDSIQVEEEKKVPRKDSSEQHIDSMIKHEDNLFDLARSYEENKDKNQSTFRLYTFVNGNANLYSVYDEQYAAVNAYHQMQGAATKVLLKENELVQAEGELPHAMAILKQAKEQDFLKVEIGQDDVMKILQKREPKDVEEIKKDGDKNLLIQIEEEKKEDSKPKKVVFDAKLFAQEQAQSKKDLKKSVIDQVKSLFNDKTVYPQCALVAGCNSDVYTEANKMRGKSVEVSIQWNVQNIGDLTWPENMKLRLIKCYPPLDFTAKSHIECLQPDQKGAILLSIQIPSNFAYHFMILHFKLQLGKNLFSPNLVVNLKVNTRPNSSEDISYFDDSRLQEQLPAKSLEQSLIEINQGNDIYNEEEMIRMASLLEEEKLGPFDRCLNIIRALRGDILSARDILSDLPTADAMSYDNTA